MVEKYQHFKIMSKSSSKIQGPHRTFFSEYESSEIKLFDDPYFQQLWLNILVEHQDTLEDLVRHQDITIYIPIYKAQTLPKSEKVKLFNMLKTLESERIRFNFFTTDFQIFQFENPDLNKMLNQAQKIHRLKEEIYKEIYQYPKRIRPAKFNDTLTTLQTKTRDNVDKFTYPDVLKSKMNILYKLYHDNHGKKMTHTAYQIIQKLLSQDIELFEDFYSPAQTSKEKEKYTESPQYLTLCQKYGKAKIDFLVHNYLK